MLKTSQIAAFRMAREEARLLAEQSEDRMSVACGFVAAAISHFCPGVAPCPVKVIRSPLAEAIGALARELDHELAAYLLGTVYTVMLPSEYRTKHGVFYTPPSVSDRLITLAESSGVCWRTARVTDISCGGGAFLAPVARRMIAARRWRSDEEAADHLQAYLRGFELNPFSAWMSEVFLTAAFRSAFPKSRCKFAGFVEVGDSLTKPPGEFGIFDLVIGNPPYGRVTLSDELRTKFARSLYGHANLYGLFTDLALRLLGPTGTLAYVTPASFLGGQYFERLRGLLAEEAPPSAIDFLESREGVFADVLQETVLVTFRRGEQREFPVSYTRLSETEPSRVEHGGVASLPAVAAAPWLLPRARNQVALVAAAKALPFRLADYGYEVSTGPLVWNRHRDRISQSRVRNSVPIVWAECVCPQGSGRFTLKAEGRNHAPWYLPSGYADPNIVRTDCVLVQRTTSKEQRRRVIAAPLPEAVVREFGSLAVENHLNMVRPRPNHEIRIDSETLAVLLNSDAVDQVFRCINGSTAVSAYELEALPLPSPADVSRVAVMLRNGSGQAAINRFISNLYANVRIGAAA